MTGKFRIRALTSGSSDKAKKLAERGVEVVRVDYDSKDSLVKAFAGVWGLFQVTDPHLQNPENEKKGFTLESEQGPSSILFNDCVCCLLPYLSCNCGF